MCSTTTAGPRARGGTSGGGRKGVSFFSGSPGQAGSPTNPRGLIPGTQGCTAPALYAQADGSARVGAGSGESGASTACPLGACTQEAVGGRGAWRQSGNARAGAGACTCGVGGVRASWGGRRRPRRRRALARSAPPAPPPRRLRRHRRGTAATAAGTPASAAPRTQHGAVSRGAVGVWCHCPYAARGGRYFCFPLAAAPPSGGAYMQPSPGGPRAAARWGPPPRPKCCCSWAVG